MAGETPGGRIIKLATVSNAPLAGLWAGVLEDAGIRCLVKAAGPGFADFSLAVCPHYLFVLESEAAAARELLEPYVEPGSDIDFAKGQIGRASCRERV